ncbi:glycerate kinase [Humisphaera borealis]|uniref:Glycerate kinase n=1 Tax=Humisphaera borealis TaxID=2807512 RepID=A0A7M2X0Y1_9BACT|nr:glycerate kinase [Humisphaera borealis]QOV91345.1 glycerate kinase [Humisphaera borealis]
MRIVIAPDKFKGSLTAPAVAAAVAVGVRRSLPDAQIDLCPIADGGDGTVAALVAATGGRFERRRVTGPLPEMKVDAEFGILGSAGVNATAEGGMVAVIEMAAASGLALVSPADRDPMATTTFGTGELLVEAAKLGSSRIILGIGGSATIDAGIGCCQACGLPVILAGGEPLSPTEPLCGRDLERVVLIKHGRGALIERTRITVACDVTNPLTGPAGAAAVYGPQKGASPAEVAWFDRQLSALAGRTQKTAEAAMPGSGAAGGLGFALRAYFPNAELRPGVDIVFDAVALRDRLRGADLCITGEGRLDDGSLHGKAPVAVATMCREMGVPCVAVVGSADVAAVANAASLFRSVLQVQTPGMTLEQAVATSESRLAELGQTAASLLR